MAALCGHSLIVSSFTSQDTVWRSRQPARFPCILRTRIELQKCKSVIVLKPRSPRLSRRCCQLPSPPRAQMAAQGSSGGGSIMRDVLSNEGRSKLDYANDRDFYSSPRFVTHVDDGFLRSLTELYRQRLPPGGEVLDLMSSWVSHLPPEVKYKRVVGHGLNAAELARNKRLDQFFVKDLNQDQKLEAAEGSFDAVVCTVSVQYLQQPERVFAEIYRVLRPGGVCIVSFSNRMFYQKAIASWRDSSGYGRIQLVRQYFQCVQGFTVAEVVKDIPEPGSEPKPKLPGPLQFLGNVLRLFQRSSQDPFYAVVAYRNFKPIHEQT
eukprot:jgi/Mesen1/7769/ME000408S06885